MVPNEDRRRSSDVMLAEMAMDIKTLIINQAEIKKQVEKTNGRVTSLEIWKAFLAGGLAIILILIVPVVLYSVEMFIGSK